MAITQIRNEQIKDLTIELAKLHKGADIILRDGSVAFTGTVSLGSQFIQNLKNPELAQDAATKAYVDATSQGLFPKASVRAISQSNLDLTTGGLLTVDGVVLVAGDRVLVAGQTAGAENGIYVVAAGAWVRADDANTSAKVKSGMFTFVTEGTTNDNSGWVLATNDPITLATTSLAFTQFSGAGQITAGAGLVKDGNILNAVGNAGRIVVNADNIDLADAGTAGTYNVATTDQYGRVTSAFLRTLTAGTTGLSIADGDGTAANPTISLDSDLVAVAGLTANGIVARTATGAAAVRTITGTAQQVTLVNGDGVAGDPVVSLTDFGTAGTYNVTTTDAKGRVSSAFLRTLTSASTGAITVANGDGTAGDPTLTVDADLVSLAGITTTGFGVRSAADTWLTRLIEVGTGLSITNASGAAANPTISMSGSLGALANLADFGIIVQTGAGTVAARTLTSNATALTVTNGGGIAGNPTLDLDADLKAVAAIATTGFGVRSAADTWVTRAIEGTAGNIVVTGGDATAANPVIDLDTVSNSNTGTFLKFNRDTFGRVTGTTAVATADITALVDATYINVSGDSMTGFLTLNADPTQTLHAVTKQYVDAVATGLDLKASVRLATTPADGNIDLATGGLLIIDQTQTVAGDRVLVKDQTDASQNGIYIVSAGAWVRASDAASDAQVSSGMFTFVSEGTAGADNGFVLITNDPITLDTTNLEFQQFSGAGQVVAGAGLTKTANTIDIITASASRIVVNGDSIDLATTGIVAGDYNVITTDVYGRTSAAFLRSLTSASTGALTITNATGVAGNPTITIDADLVSLAGISSTGFGVRTAADTWTTRTIEVTSGLTVTNGDAVAGNVSIGLDTDLSAIAALTTNGIAARTATGTWTTRTVTSASTGALTIADGDGVLGDPTITIDADLVALAGLTTTGFAVRSAADTWVNRTIAVGSGLSITNAAGLAGDPTISMTGALSSLAALATTGIIVQTVAGTVVTRAIESANTLITVTNGDAVAGNPSLDLALSTNWMIRGNGTNKGQAYRSVFSEAATTVDDITYSIAYALAVGTEQVYLNGLLQRIGASYDYTVVGGAIVFNSANQGTDVVLVTYFATN